MKNYPTFVKENKESNDIDVEVAVTTHTIEIQSEKMDTFNRLIKKITRLAKFMKLPVPVVSSKGVKTYYTLGAEYDEKITKNITDFITDKWDEIKKAKDAFDKNQRDKNGSHARIGIILSTNVNVIEVKLADVIKPKEEWTLLGVIDHKEGLIKSAPNQQVPFELIPKDLFNGCQCDHCNKPTRRNKSVFIQNNDTHKIMRVGGTCIKYYLGMDYEKVLEYVSELSLFMEYGSYNDGGFDDEDWHGGGWGNKMEYFADVKDTVKYFFAHTKTKGYMSKSSAEKLNINKGEDEKHVQTTKDIVLDILDYVFSPVNTRGMRSEDANAEIARHAEEYQRVRNTIDKESDDDYNQFIQFVEDTYKENNFLVNVKNMIDAGAYKLSHMNYVLSACSMFYGKRYYDELKKLSEEERNAKKEKEKVESNWVGTVGEKMELNNLEIVHITGFQNDFGWTNVYKLKDENGNIFTKFGTINPKFIVNDKTDVEVGAVVSALVDINKHDTYKDVKQTTLGRFSMIPKKK